MAEYDYITIDGVDFPRPVTFEPKREDVYVAKITTLSGKVIGDRLGWKYSDITLNWDALPQDLVEALTTIEGSVVFEFDDASGMHEEEVMRNSAVSMRHRYTINGQYYWRNVSIDFEFSNVHQD